VETHGSHPFAPSAPHGARDGTHDGAVGGAQDGALDGAVDGRRVAVLSGPALGALDRLVDALAAESAEAVDGMAPDEEVTAGLDEVVRLLEGPDGPAEPVLLLAHRAAALRLERDNLRVALETNRSISAAVGVLMALQQLAYEEAFDLLVSTSQNSNRKLRDVAEDVVRTGALPGVDGS
jgi:hypothetical protein